jgi:hypothetical protein
MAGDTFNTATGYENVSGGSTETPESIEARRRSNQATLDQQAARRTAQTNLPYNIAQTADDRLSLAYNTQLANEPWNVPGNQWSPFSALPLVGGAAGFALGGPVGAAIGAGLGGAASAGINASGPSPGPAAPHTPGGMPSLGNANYTIAEAQVADRAAGAPAPTNPQLMGSGTGLFQGQGTAVQNGTQAQAQSLFDQANSASATAPQVAGPALRVGGQPLSTGGGALPTAPAPATTANAGAPLLRGGSVSSTLPAGATSATRQPFAAAPAPGLFATAQPAAAASTGGAPSNGYTVGQQAQQMPIGAAPQMVDPSQLGAPGNVAGQLGQGYQVGGIGNVAGQMGAAPQVGNVGNIQNGAAPGSIQGTLGNQGATNAAQEGMLGRLEGFLDSPDGPSVAQAQLQQSQADNMAQLIGAARSGRGGAGAQAQQLLQAQSEGSAIMSDTAGQMATLRAQEDDMRRNRQLNAIGLGGQMATAQRAGDLGFRGQELQAAQGDQSTGLGARGQDLSASMANQSTQTALEQLRGNLGIAARGQDLSALQGDQSTALGLEGIGAQTAVSTRGQDLSALQGDQAAGISTRGQDLSALQGNQQAATATRGQDVSRELGLGGINAQLRGQDAGVLMSDADRQVAAQRLQLDQQLGLTNAGLTAQGQGLNYGLGMSGLELGAAGQAQQAYDNQQQRELQEILGRLGATTGLQQSQIAAAAVPQPPSLGEQIGLSAAQAGINGLAAYGSNAALPGPIPPPPVDDKNDPRYIEWYKKYYGG